MRLFGSLRNPMPQYLPSAQYATQPLFGLLKPTCLIVCVSSGFYGGVADGRARVLVRELCCGLDKSVLREAGAVDVRH